MKIDRLGYACLSFLASILLLGQAKGANAEESNWIVRPVINLETSTVNCIGIYQDYSHQLTKDQLILFIPEQFDQIYMQLNYGEGQPSMTMPLTLSEEASFAVVIQGEIFEQMIKAQQLTIKLSQAGESVGEYVLNLAGITEAVALLQTETCGSGEIYRFPSVRFLMYEDPAGYPMPQPRMGPGVPSNTNIQFPRPSRDGLPESTGGGGTRLMEEE